MILPKWAWAIRAELGGLPAFIFTYLFSFIYTTGVLRTKAACCPYPRVRELLLRRSGVRMGRDTRVGYGVLVHGIGRDPCAVTLGQRVAVAPYVCFVTSSYPNYSRLNNHPELQRNMTRLGPIRVEDDAWIGAGAIILPDVTIGQCAIIGAGAVVTRNVPAYSVVAGVPARLIRTLTEEGESRDPSPA
jgi:maltose O-acetyltransferase